MLIAKFCVVLCMLLGLVGIFIHKIPGTPLIFFAALIYSLIIGCSVVDITWIIILGGLMLAAELGNRYMHDRLMSNAGIDKVFVLDAIVGAFASLLIAKVLTGPVLGGTLWLLLIGKNLIPIIRTSSTVVIKLFSAALFRFSIAVTMIAIVSFKVL